jgi:RNA polymerase sigma-70 factor, ECF subfamily
MVDESDEALVKAVQNGQSEVFGELITRYEDKLRRYGTRFLPRPEAVTDCVQDTFIKAYTNIQSFDIKQRFSPWIYRIAHNTFVNELRRNERHHFPFLGLEADTFFAMTPSNETADSEALTRERVEEMKHLLHNLTPKYREIVILYYFEELSYEEISAVLRIPITTVGVRLNRSRFQLKKLYQANP